MVETLSFFSFELFKHHTLEARAGGGGDLSGRLLAHEARNEAKL